MRWRALCFHVCGSPSHPVALARLRWLYCAGSVILALCVEPGALGYIVLTLLRWLFCADSIPFGSFGLHERRHLSLELQPLLQTLAGIPTGQGEGGEAAAMMFTRKMEEVMTFTDCVVPVLFWFFFPFLV